MADKELIEKVINKVNSFDNDQNNIFQCGEFAYLIKLLIPDAVIYSVENPSNPHFVVKIGDDFYEKCYTDSARKLTEEEVKADVGKRSVATLKSNSKRSKSNKSVLDTLTAERNIRTAFGLPNDFKDYSKLFDTMNRVFDFSVNDKTVRVSLNDKNELIDLQVKPSNSLDDKFKRCKCPFMNKLLTFNDLESVLKFVDSKNINFDDLSKLKNELFDAPESVKRAFNEVIGYFDPDKTDTTLFSGKSRGKAPIKWLVVGVDSVTGKVKQFTVTNCKNDQECINAAELQLRTNSSSKGILARLVDPIVLPYTRHNPHHNVPDTVDEDKLNEWYKRPHFRFSKGKSKR